MKGAWNDVHPGGVGKTFPLASTVPATTAWLTARVSPGASRSAVPPPDGHACACGVTGWGQIVEYGCQRWGSSTPAVHSESGQGGVVHSTLQLPALVTV